MKRFIAIAAVLVMLVCTLAACGGSDSTEPTKPATFNGTTKDVDLTGVVQKINAQFDLGETREVTDSERYYGISAADVKQFLAQKPQKDTDYNQIVICEAATPDAVSRIETKLNKELDTNFNKAKSYAKEDLEAVQKCKVVANGKYVYLVISKDAEAINALIESEIN